MHLIWRTTKDSHPCRGVACRFLKHYPGYDARHAGIIRWDEEDTKSVAAGLITEKIQAVRRTRRHARWDSFIALILAERLPGM